MRFVLSLACLLALFQPAKADETAVLCVQQQLQAAGFAIGTVDGQIGPRTQQAWRGFAQAEGLDSGMVLDVLSAPNHCLRMGVARPELQRFWPANTQPFNFVYAPEIPEEARLRIRDRALHLLPRVAALLDVPVAARSHVIVGTQARPLASLIRDTITYRIRGLDSGLQRDCAVRGQIGAAASRGMMRLCIPALDGGAEKQPLNDLDFILAHEITHLIEMQIEGEPLRQPPGQAARIGHPPLWLIEGLADLVGAHLTTGRSVASLRREAVSRLAADTLPLLAELDGRQALYDHRTMIYRVGMVAVADLVDRRGFASFGRMFAAMGNGTPFESAFRNEFDESPTSFQSRIDRELRPARAYSGSTAGSTRPPFPDPTPDQAQAIRCVQSELARLGFDPGGIDGVIGPRMQGAFDDYRRANPRNSPLLTPFSARHWCNRLRGEASR